MKLACDFMTESIYKQQKRRRRFKNVSMFYFLFCFVFVGIPFLLIFFRGLELNKKFKKKSFLKIKVKF
jgi:hypothetical protein